MEGGLDVGWGRVDAKGRVGVRGWGKLIEGVREVGVRGWGRVDAKGRVGVRGWGRLMSGGEGGWCEGVGEG